MFPTATQPPTQTNTLWPPIRFATVSGGPRLNLRRWQPRQQRQPQAPAPPHAVPSRRPPMRRAGHELAVCATVAERMERTMPPPPLAMHDRFRRPPVRPPVVLQADTHNVRRYMNMNIHLFPSPHQWAGPAGPGSLGRRVHLGPHQRFPGEVLWIIFEAASRLGQELYMKRKRCCPPFPGSQAFPWGAEVHLHIHKLHKEVFLGGVEPR